MAENYTPQNVTSFINDTTAVVTVNNNFAAISSALSDVLSRSGVSPNQMTSTLDMNNHQIINLPPPATATSPARLVDISNGQITIVTATTGTSGHSVPFLDGTNTWSGVQNFNSGILSTISNPVAFTAVNVFNNFSVATDNLDASGIGNNTAQTSIYYGFGGSSTKGARQGLLVNSQLLSATSASNTNRNYVGGVFQAQAVSSDGGGIGTEKGAFFGCNPIVILNAAATNTASAVGGEVNTTLTSGSSTLDKYGWAVVQTSTDAVSGSRNDAAYYLANQAGAVGWKNGIQFGDGLNQFPVKSSGTLIKSVSGSVTNGIDISSTTFTGNAILTNGFTVGNVGNISTGGAGVSQGLISMFGSVSGFTTIQVASTGNLVTVSQPVQIGVNGSTGGSLTLAGLTSGNATISVSSTLGTLQLGAGNVTIDSSGNVVTTLSNRIGSLTAPTAGGDTSRAYFMSSTSGLGIYYGSGAPTISAAQGSLYLRTDGSSTSTRLYVNTTGSNVWTNFTSAT